MLVDPHEQKAFDEVVLGHAILAASLAGDEREVSRLYLADPRLAFECVRTLAELLAEFHHGGVDAALVHARSVALLIGLEPHLDLVLAEETTP